MKVTVYSRNNCPQCSVVKSRLVLRRISFEEVNIDDDAEIRAWLVAEGHRQVPVVYVDGIATRPEAIVASDEIA